MGRKKDLSRIGEAIPGEMYETRVPEGDPLLKALKRFHGRDRKNRNVQVRPSVPRRIIGETLMPGSSSADI